MSIAENIARIQAQVAVACRASGRPQEAVQLMAVSKVHPPEALLEAHAAGLRLFGENRVQEYAAKQPILAAAGLFPGASPAQVHCIGPVQSNKAARAAELFSAVDTLDSLRLAERLDRAAAALGKRLPVLLEIKLSPEPTKHGIDPDTPAFDGLLECLPDLTHLQPCGLMTVPPYTENPEHARPFFRRLRELRDTLTQRHPRLTLPQLSMGMSHDFPIAIAEGSTVVRIGTAIFGARPKP